MNIIVRSSVLFVLASAAAALLGSRPASAAPKAMFNCVNTASGTIIVRKKCKKSETVMTLSNASPFAGAIAAGQTVYGVIGVDADAYRANGDWFGIASLPAAASAALDNQHVVVVETEAVTGLLASTETAQKSHCKGTVIAPSADAGYVCIYPAEASSSVNQVVGISIPYADDAEGGSRWGFGLGGVSSAAGDIYLRGTWAYTAP